MSSSQLTLALFETTAVDLGPASVPAPQPDAAPHAPHGAIPPAQPPAGNYRLVGERALARDWKGRAADNLSAIRLAHRIEAEARPATDEERARLIRFIGFGASALANGVFRRAGSGFREGWDGLGGELEQLVSEAELAGLARATQYAHFTPEFMVRAIWRALERMGVTGGRILEPGCGSGLFLALAPEAIAAKAAFTGIEADPVTARIARLLYPQASIRVEDFIKADLAETYDLALGNPPFSDRIVRGDTPSSRLGLSLHDFFIARAVERLAPGGLAAFVTSRFTMDKASGRARAHIAGMADLLGAVRLPEGAMRAAAGTDVVVDIMVLCKRREDEAATGPAWQDLVEVAPAENGEGALLANRYYHDHPEMVLGTHAWTSGPHGPAYTCRPRDAAGLEDALDTALARLPRGVAAAPQDVRTLPAEATRLAVGRAADGAVLKEGSYLIGADDALMQITGGRAVAVAVKNGLGTVGMFAKHARIVRRLIPIRDALRAVLRAQEAGESWGADQGRLRMAYAGFVERFGPINRTMVSTTRDPRSGEERESLRRPNLQPFLDDPDCWLVSAIEDYDAETGTATRGPIFEERVLAPPAEPVITSAADALAVALHETGGVDLARIAELLGRSEAEALALLGGSVFRDPESGRFETADAYLSGAVRAKLALAEQAALDDAGFERNVQALCHVQPVDLRPSEITARLGAPWLPAEVIEAFAAEVIGVTTRVRHTVEIAAWSFEIGAFSGQASATSEWGTDRRHAGQLLDDALHGAIPQIWDTWRDEQGEHRVLNAEATEAAKEKLAKLKSGFEDWIWTDPDRTERLARIYNDRFNNLVPRHFDGGHLQLPGASSAIRLHAHQKRVIWRMIASGATYVAHSVGAGKTFSLTAAIMEQKRLGLIGKAMLVVPGHCLAQASRDFLRLYPNARILVADESTFVARKRQRFLARAATASWDCIIITHSAFKFIPTPTAFEDRLIRAELQAYEELLEAAPRDDRLTRKRLERLKEGLKAKLEALTGRKDDMVTIAELGVDQLIVDEAQEFRKLSFATNMTSLKGVDPDGSQRAWDLFVKARFVMEKQPRRALILASGTPVTNTMGELFTAQRFLAPDLLAERGVHAFDAWASTFGDTRTELELQPSGRYKPVTRFSAFINVPELIAMFRSVADVVLKDDLKGALRVPAIEGGQRQITTVPASPAFKAYQTKLDARIKAIEARQGKVEKGDDILLAVITDGRHAALDMRLVDLSAKDDPDAKLAALIGKVEDVWRTTAERVYHRPDGRAYPLKGAGQLIFSDLGTPSVEASRGFSAYRWIKSALVRRGVPAAQVAFMQDFKTSSAKQGLFAAFNAGQVRILIGSTQTMGTGVNVQTRLAALHHLDVPWLPSDIEQREGRIERQGNQNEEIAIHAYATLGSMDAPMWQNNERKARFIAMALAGDRSVRRLDDAGDQANQFALAKAIASGDPRLMRKAGLESEIARLHRLREAHWDDQHAVRGRIRAAEATIAAAPARLAAIEADLAQRIDTQGDRFAMTIEERRFSERRKAGQALLLTLERARRSRRDASWSLGAIGGFTLGAHGHRAPHAANRYQLDLVLGRSGGPQPIAVDPEITPLGLIARLEHVLGQIETERLTVARHRDEASVRLADYQGRQGQTFPHDAELEHTQAELAALEAELAADTGAPQAEAA
ncbi:helicase-related protein [Marinivivus vitaminiproducens]|uniref:helicase-related protein n=1 Tax=Marinivivus vitaminiproducens TaxID=3035935 RepID=UPI00279C7C8F|nr:helicase-related protein [Geminicoccaceae bacterium SCSIO 64248]